jgi:hypothetical protein
VSEDPDVMIESLLERIRQLERERAFWSRVARAYARKHVVAKIMMRVLGGGWARRERDILELRRMIDALTPDTPADLGK